MNETEQSLSERLRAIRLRSINRDQHYLLSARKNAMRSLAADFAEWIVQETKDLLQTMEILKSLGNQGINLELQPYEKRVDKIQKTHVRKVITPMRKIGRGTSGTKIEEERFTKFQTTLENAFCVIQELKKIRGYLKIITVTIEHIENANRNDNIADKNYIR